MMNRMFDFLIQYQSSNATQSVPQKRGLPAILKTPILNVLMVLFITFSLASQTGCSSAPKVIKTYSDKNKTRNEIAIVTNISQKIGKKRYGSFFRSYAKLEPDKKLEFIDAGNYWAGGFAGTLHMLPGQYVLTVHCAVNAGYQNDSFAILAVDIQVEAGGSYDVMCGPVVDDPSSVKVTTSKR